MATTSNGHRHSISVSQNHKAQLATAYNELGKELSSQKIRVVGNYTLGRVIGEGTYGKVRMGVHRLSGTRVAIKQIPKAMSASLTREIHHHRQLHHPNVTQLYEVIATESNIWLITELCSGGELFDYLAEKGRLGEEETRVLFGQLCLAVAYVHEKGIVHRDLKLENVLLDERCRVKLGDFGFTREFERGNLLETFCGTTGYASPEMLLAKKYLGPEVDVWSLGVILYTVLTGTLPFDDDDEGAMKEKVIRGEFEDPEWLSGEVRDLIKNIIQVDPTKRLTIAQTLAHPWFTARASLPLNPAASQSSLSLDQRPPSPTPLRPSSPAANSQLLSASSGTSDSTFHSASSEFRTSVPTSLEDVSSNTLIPTPQEDGQPQAASTDSSNNAGDHKAQSDSAPAESSFPSDASSSPSQTPPRPLFPRTSSGSNSGSKVPPAYPTRTPARTKRRSVSSTLSDPSTPTFDKSAHPSPPQDFSSLLSTPAPIIFSTPLERELLNSLSMLGLDTGQIVHSVLTDACDATGALWWMLKRKAERKALEKSDKEATEAHETPKVEKAPKDEKTPKPTSVGHSSRESRSPIPLALTQAHSAPELQFIPATPIVASTIRPITPPRAASPNNPLLSPSPSIADSAARSHPSTPSGSMKDGNGSKGRKARSGSVSIMQRATTALEAAGLVRKKSTETVRDEKEREKEKSTEKRIASVEESRTSGGSSKLTKSPPLRAVKDAMIPTTPPPSSDSVHAQAQVGSPWVIAGSQQSPPPSGSDSPRDTLSALPNIEGKLSSGGRNRASLLSAFRMWFKEDAKGKRKDDPVLLSQTNSYASGVSTSSATAIPPRNRSAGKQRVGGSQSKFASTRKGAQRSKRASISSRRSSSVNSRRSSVHSTQYQVMESPYAGEQVAPMTRQRSDPSRRSFGSHTPNSEREDYMSRPSSTLSFNQPRHRKSPSASSAGSMHPARTASPLPKYHRRGDSGSSTRVVRQMQPTPPPAHLRSNSTSSAHSLSSRQGSLYELSESDSRRNNSPVKRQSRQPLEDTSRRAHASTAFVAHKRQTPFGNPNGNGYLNSFGRSSWKKSWGLEPPGWQTRTAHPAIEVLAISPPADAPLGIRDVFSGRLSMGDESDWVDEDDDSPGYVGGLGQMASSVPSTSGGYLQPPDSPSIATIPRNATGRSGTSKRTTVSTPVVSGNTAARAPRGKAGRSPVGRTSPLPGETTMDAVDPRGGRRQLPAGRSGPAFRHPIQEEDEGEEE